MAIIQSPDHLLTQEHPGLFLSKDPWDLQQLLYWFTNN